AKAHQGETDRDAKTTCISKLWELESGRQVRNRVHGPTSEQSCELLLGKHLALALQAAQKTDGPRKAWPLVQAFEAFAKALQGMPTWPAPGSRMKKSREGLKRFGG